MKKIGREGFPCSFDSGKDRLAGNMEIQWHFRLDAKAKEGADNKGNASFHKISLKVKVGGRLQVELLAQRFQALLIFFFTERCLNSLGQGRNIGLRQFCTGHDFFAKAQIVTLKYWKGNFLTVAA